MTAKMLALLLAGGFAWVAGTATNTFVPRASTTVAQLQDAGIVQNYTPRRLGCMIRLDGSYVEKRPIVAVALVANANGTRDTIWPRAAIPFREQIGDPNANCRVIAVLTWAQVADFEAALTDQTGSCACWRQDAGQNCLQSDGGTATRNAHNEFQPNDWVGAGCVAKACGEMFGVPNWPVQCPR